MTDASLFKLQPVLVVVICTVGEHAGRFVQWVADLATHGRNSVDQRDQLRDVIAVSTGERPRQWHAICFN